MAERAHPEDPGFQGTIYETRMHDRYRFASRFTAGQDVVDIACGTCWGWIHLGNARSLAGLDLSEEALREALRLRFGRRLAAGAMDALPYADRSFDVVVCLEAIEHVDPSAAARFLAECARVLRPGGLLILSTPLRQSGRHSGNPWHWVEYEEEEIRSLVDPAFECVHAEIDAAGEPRIFLFAGRLRAEPAPAAVRWTHAPIHRKAAQWLEQAATDLGFRFTLQGDATVTSTAMGVELAEGLGVLDAVPPGREALLRRILDAQDPASGLFLELAAEVPSPVEAIHDRTYQAWMTTYHCIQALDALGARPRHRLAWLDPFLDKERLIEWLEGLNWSNPWLESNRIMQLMTGLLFRLKWEECPQAAERYHDVLDWLNEHQDPKTGLWGTERGASLLNALAGAYHFVPYYRYARRPVRAWSKMVDACLQLQREDGLFGPDMGGGACEDADAIDLLCSAARAQKRLRPEVRRALTRAFWAIWNMQREDGSFPYADVAGGSVFRYSSYEAMEARVNGGDMWSTWFRLVALNTIRSLIGEDLPTPGAWKFRRFPALGFHLDDTAISSDAEPSHRAIWFRPLPAPSAPQRPRVAVVVTCFNLGEYIGEALSSIREQTLSEVETVIVDDGSTEPYTVARLDALAREGWRLIRTANQGLPAARNTGIRATRAPYVCCLDADDRLRRDYLERAAALLDQKPEAGFVSCFYALFDEGQGTVRYTRPRLPEMLARNEAPVSGVFRRQAWLDAGAYCEMLPAMQDWDLWISILEKGWQGALLPEVLFDYRIRAGSMLSDTKKPFNYSRISAMIAARHRDLFAKNLIDIIRIKARIFAEQVEYSARRDEAFAAEIRALRRMLAPASRPSAPAECAEDAAAGSGRGAAAEGAEYAPSPEPRPGQTLPEEGAEAARDRQAAAKQADVTQSLPPGAAEPFPRPSVLRTFVWTLAQALHPRARWRGARNLAWFIRLLTVRPARRRWNGFFEARYYTDRRQDVAAARIHPALHYALAGAWEGADPSEQFSTGYYWKRNSDVAQAGLNPLLHYALFGADEGRPALPASGLAALAEFSAAVRSEGAETVEPLVSVVVPCFNYGRYVEEALQSVLGQTFRNTEILIVEGGSTDGETRALVRRLERAGLPRVRVLYQDTPHLAGANRNFGISHARGRYVCCLDADDLLDSAYLELAVFLLEFGGADFVYPSVQCFGESDGQWLVGDPSWPAILRQNQVSTVAVFRRELWETLGGYRDWGLGEQHLPEDWDFWIRAVAEGFRGMAIRQPMMLYRVRKGSLSRNQASTYQEWADRLEKVNATLKERPAPAERPRGQPARASWASFEEEPPEPGAVMMALPFFTEGGAEKIFRALARRWRQRGAKLVVVTTLELRAEMPDRLDVLRQETPYVYPLAQLFRGREELAADFVYYLLRRHRISLIYLAGCDMIYRLLPEIRKEFPGVPVVDQIFNEEVHFHTNRTLAAYLDCTVVPGRRIARRLLDEYGEQESRIAVIPHGVELPDRMAGAALRAPAGFPFQFVGRPVVGFFGRFSEEKGPVDFVKIAAEVWRRMPDVRFVMTGDGPESDVVASEVRRRGLSTVVHRPGFVDDVHAWMAAADVVVVPSRLDGMPLVIFEAQALEKPVVASRTGSIPEVIEDGVTGLLRDPGDVAGFAGAICSLLESEELRRRMGQAARETVLREHSQEVMLERYFNLFDRLAAGRKCESR